MTRHNKDKDGSTNKHGRRKRDQPQERERGGGRIEFRARYVFEGTFHSIAVSSASISPGRWRTPCPRAGRDLDNRIMARRR